MFEVVKFVKLFSKSEIDEICLIEKLTSLQNFTIWKINKFTKNCRFGKLSKFLKLTNC